jgi:hypothetical protein
MWNLVLAHLKIVLILTQVRCKFCAEHTIGSKFVSVALDGTPRWHGYVESCFSPFGDCISVDA